jgi:putative ABC transport system substrate-binding protein
MRRREFITLLGGAAAAWPLAAGAQQGERMRQIGWLMPLAENDPFQQPQHAAFLVELRKLGWVNGRNIRIDNRFGDGDSSRIRILAAELVATAPEVIIVSGTPAAIALQQSTRTIPIVFMNIPDPIANGLVTSITRPGGNITGFAQYEQSIAAKLLELLKQIAPRVTRVALVYDPANSNWPGYLAELEAAATSLGVQVSGVALRDAVEIEPAIDAFAREPNGGLVVKASPIPIRESARLIARATQRGLPAVYEHRYDVAAGGLASYGVDTLELCRGAAGYLGRILKGERVGDLPVQFSTRFELAINTTTAKALGLEVPLALLIRADELLE